MKMMRKSRVTQAVAAAVFAAGLSMTATAPVSAAPSANPHGVGDVLLYPYYTTQNGFNTLFHLVNTDGARTIIAKVRLREYQTSEDVLDFTVILSPNDVFTGYIKQGDNGPVFVKTDNTCTSPNVGGKNAEISFTTGTNLDSSHTGHIEVITMGALHNGNVAVLPQGTAAGAAAGANAAALSVTSGALHDSTGVPADCAAVDARFSSSGIGNLQAAVTAANANTAGGAFANASVNALTGHSAFLDSANGVAAATRPLAIMNATTPNASGILDNPCGGVDGNLICGQFSNQFFVPNLANVNGIINTATNNANLVRFRELEAAINGSNVWATGASSIHNEWSANEANGVSSEMVLTMPLKHIYMDTTPVSAAPNSRTSATIFANGANTDAFGNTTAAGAAFTGALAWNDVDAAIRLGDELFNDVTGCVNYSRNLIDREESNTTPGTTASGPIAASIATQICNETQVFTFNDGVTNPENASAAIDTSSLSQQFGWFNMTLAAEDGDALSNAAANTGFAFWQRNFGDASKNFGQILDNTRN